MIELTKSFNTAIAILLTLFYLYQIGYLMIGLVEKHRKQQSAEHRLHRYAVIISARNEANVIGGLIQSLKEQNYPSELLDIYVIADNCTDNTARVAEMAGAYVYRRFNKTLVGKGYAMDYLFSRLSSEGRDDYEGYFVFDADNYVDPNFVREMNKVFDTGKYAAITSYRNSKNFGANWISAGYGLWFLREARFLNYPRMKLGISCAISGTGFLVSAKTIRENGGWPYHLLTEDIEFSVSCALKGHRIGYCDKAVIYDEQPTTFKQSWDQRMRWSKGFYQVNTNYSGRLIRSFLSKPSLKSWSCYDMFVTVAPGMLLTLAMLAFNGAVCLACMLGPEYMIPRVVQVSTQFMFGTVFNFYLGLLLYGLLTVLCEWKQIQIPGYKKILYVFTFPIFMFTYIPISLSALVRKVDWTPIYHSGNRTVLRKAS